MWWTTLICGWLIFLTWLVGAGPVILMRRSRDLQRRTRHLTESKSDVRVSVIVPARDEAENIEACLRSLLLSKISNLEVIAVNDRSRDETGDVMDRIAAEDSRMTVIHLDELPDGWLGKTHAMHIGAQSAQYEFLLFTDGDVLFEPDAIRLACQCMSDAKVDHLCLMPLLVSGGYWETAFVCYFGVIFVMGTQPWYVNTRMTRLYAGVGAFNLIRKQAYEQFHGHESIRLDVLDDVKLGKLVKRSGFRQDILFAGGLVRVRWQPTAWDAIRGLEKNGFASHDYSVWKLIGSTLVFFILFFVPYGSVFLYCDERIYGFVASFALMHLIYGSVACSIGADWRIVPALPIAALGMLYAFWRSAFVTLRQGGVRWRDTFYPLATLRRHLYR